MLIQLPYCDATRLHEVCFYALRVMVLVLVAIGAAGVYELMERAFGRIVMRAAERLLIAAAIEARTDHWLIAFGLALFIGSAFDFVISRALRFVSSRRGPGGG